MNVFTSISRYKSCNLWLDGLRTESTKAAYSVHLSLFCKFYHVSPDDLLKLKPDELKQMVIKYTLELRNKSKNVAGKPKMGEMSVNSVKQYLAGVKSFLNEHEINLPWNKLARFYPDEVTNEFRSYTRQELSKLISLADLRDRCIILRRTIAQSGNR